MPSRISGRVALGLACSAIAATGALEAATTVAQGAPANTVAIENCHVKRGGDFIWFYCGIASDAAANTTVLVNYRVNLVTFKPATAGTWFSRSGTLRFTGGGQQVRNVKFAVRNLSPAKVRERLRVTLSDATGATITRATAKAAGSA